MEPTRNPSPDMRPGRAMQPGAPRERPLQRPVFNDFTRPPVHRDPSMRTPARPAPQPLTAAPVTPQQPVTPVQPAHHTSPAHHHTPTQPPPAPQPVAPTAPAAPSLAPAQPALSSALRPPATFSDFAANVPAASPRTPTPEAQPSAPAQPTAPIEHLPHKAPEAHHAKHTKAQEAGSTNKSSHSVLIGFICFVLLCALFFLPLLPGKVLDNFPGSSASFSTGDQALSCIDTLGPVHSAVKYDTKMGFPITYNYSTTTTQTATCKGVAQSAVGGHTSQFNPLGGLIDMATAFAVAFGVAKLWRWFAGRNN